MINRTGWLFRYLKDKLEEDGIHLSDNEIETYLNGSFVPYEIINRKMTSKNKIYRQEAMCIANTRV